MRKQPRQARSRATVKAITSAAARVLGDRGWAGFTTNEVAEVAGVSIGSLYQYFPDKRSLTEAVRREHLDDVLGVMRQTADGTRSLRRRVIDLVDGLIAAHSVHPRLHRVLLDEAPRHIAPDTSLDALESEYMGRYQALVAACSRSRDTGDGELVAQVLSDAIDGVIHNAACRGTLQSPKLKGELVEMVCAYLRLNFRSGSA